MNWQWTIAALLGALALAGFLYGLHHACLWLERRGLLFYIHKKPSSSAASCFVAVQQIIEPATHTVVQAKDTVRQYKDDETTEF